MAKQGYKAKRLPITKEDVEKISDQKLRERMMGEVPNEVPKDDTGPGDLDPSTATRLGITVTRTREFENYKIVRKNPHGFHFILTLENELGSFTGLKGAQDALLAYLQKQKEKETNGQKD